MSRIGKNPSDLPLVFFVVFNRGLQRYTKEEYEALQAAEKARLGANTATAVTAAVQRDVDAVQRDVDAVIPWIDVLIDLFMDIPSVRDSKKVLRYSLTGALCLHAQNPNSGHYETYVRTTNMADRKETFSLMNDNNIVDGFSGPELQEVTKRLWYVACYVRTSWDYYQPEPSSS
jgi:hypothetical protein